MADRILVKIPSEGMLSNAEQELSWRAIDARGEWLGEAEKGTVEVLAEAIANSKAELWLLVPGARVSTRPLPISAKEKRHMERLLPYQLEDDLACDVEVLHFAFGAVDKGTVTIAYVDKAWFRSVLEKFSEFSIEVAGSTPEPLLLPCDEQSCTISQNEELMVHQANGTSFSVNDTLASMVLNSLGENLAINASLTLVAGDDNALSDLESELPEDLLQKVEHRFVRDGWGALNIHLGRATLDASMPWLNLCVGEFSRRLPLMNWWHSWRKVALLGCVTLTLFIVANFSQVQQLKSAQAIMQKDIETAFRSVVPRGAMVDPLRQLKAKMKSEQGTAKGSDSVLLISLVAPVIESLPDVALQGIQYNHDRNELRFSVKASSFKNIEALRNRLDGGNFKATLMSASAQGGVHSARLKIAKLR